MADHGSMHNGFLTLNGVDYSNNVHSFAAPQGVETQDNSRWGTATRIHTPGLLTGSFEIELIQDYANGDLDDAITALLDARSTFPIEWRPVNTAVGATNPKRTATVFITEYTPFAGRVGDNNIARLTLALASAITRAEA